MASDFCLVCEESELLIPRESRKLARSDVSTENPVTDEDDSQIQFPIRQLESTRSPVMSAESQETILKASDHVTGISEGSSVSESQSSDLGYGSVSSLPCPSQQTVRSGTSSEVRKSQESKSVCSQSSGSDGPVCRICHDGEDKEELISPCHCTGSVGMLHLSCLERWLGTSHTTRCELCRYEFMLEKTTPPLSEFFKSPPHPNHGLNTICDISCFFVLTPVSIISAYLCIRGALRYSQWPGSWQMQGLILLTTCLIVIYITWLGVALHYHTGIYVHFSYPVLIGAKFFHGFIAKRAGIFGKERETSHILSQTGLRELFEETGLRLTEEDCVGEQLLPLALWESVYPPKLSLGAPARHHVVVYLYAKLKSPLTSERLLKEVIIDPNEVAACVWLDREIVSAIVNQSEESGCTKDLDSTMMPDTLRALVLDDTTEAGGSHHSFGAILAMFWGH
ncbi:hypothetical protein C0Q70_20068 [Pomacea canaliculata]|uniref:Uncharacterized protein n=1 Tax=Pomacea canaliculata TaxID=400727 RepID=A0A2T7NEH3_POMCA|nr:hypothetical protein C0Q70_20068 [Pomacea canaliculata]